MIKILNIATSIHICINGSLNIAFYMYLYIEREREAENLILNILLLLWLSMMKPKLTK